MGKTKIKGIYDAPAQAELVKLKSTLAHQIGRYVATREGNTKEGIATIWVYQSSCYVIF